MTSPPDNRLTTAVCRALLEALDAVEFGPHAPGVVMTTSSIDKFYSNGLDLAHAIETEGFWPLLYGVWRRLLTYPMPTVALLNGHTFAGGLMLSMAHDYRLAPSPRGYLCLNEVLFGAPLKPAMAAIFRAKLSPQSYRTVALEGRRMTGPDAVRLGVADGVAASLDDALAFVRERDLVSKPAKGVYGAIKAEMYDGLVAELHGAGLEAEEARFAANGQAEEERKEFGKIWFEQWSKMSCQ
ncbi:Enoyl-CoA hydratase/isomerase family [Geosmithia morbida]|uniref:Enoyl-CoA hydratase/isomerase family n=1 Tax=Geosmithia morbida TaxID=1094350 RepID=A0A9P4YPP3_9HYPO|nr:Enoyl-CoA hydratase/isomerase family [Geosmithia morbida]KAF4119527.1 Enoyl-CoA hydratase/isomerase family [Geosmithia morbida]